MKAWHARLSLSCAVCTFLLGTTASLFQSQDSKPDAAPAEKVVRAGTNGVGVPTCIYCPPAEYSNKARVKKLEGTVVLDVTISAEGKPKAIILVKGLGQGLDEQAEKALKSWKFNPAKDSSGNPVAARVQVQVSFHLYK